MVNKDKYKIFFDVLENNFQIAESVAKKFVEFCEIIQQSNEHFNLTSIKKMDDMLIKHILDSLSIQHLVSGRKNIRYWHRSRVAWGAASIGKYRIRFFFTRFK